MHYCALHAQYATLDESQRLFCRLRYVTVVLGENSMALLVSSVPPSLIVDPLAYQERSVNEARGAELTETGMLQECMTLLSAYLQPKL